MAKNLNDGRAEALKALVSSLAPQDGEKLSDAQVDVVASRLDQIFGNIEDAQDRQRNEKGEILNEEGLPIIEISEPVEESEAQRSDTPGTADIEITEEPDVIPLALLSTEERARVQARCNRILDLFEVEEEKELAKEAEQEEREQREEHANREAEAKAERERKLAQREMQKKMGKALLRNIAEARAKEEKEKAEMLASPIAGPSSCPTSPGGTRKPKKKVSFANIPDVDVEKPKLEQEKSHITIGDVSIGILKGNTKRVRLKKDELANLPMKLEVVERIPGKWKENASSGKQEEGDSDDESPSEEPSHTHTDEDDQSDDDDDVWRSYGNMDDEEDEDNFDALNQAQLQREVALDYIEKRRAIGPDIQQFATSEARANEWDAPEVPLEATLAHPPPKSKSSRFKASLQGSSSSNSNSLPSGRSHLLAKAVRNGKLTAEGHLSGGHEGDSDPEDGDETRTQRALEMLMRGEVASDTSLGDTHSSSSVSQAAEPSPRPPSKFAARRQLADVSNSSPNTSGNAPKASSPSSNTQASSPFRKPPTVISTPKTSSTTALWPKTTNKSSQPPPHKAPIFPSMIVDSPSFPAPGSFTSSVIVDSPSFPQTQPTTSSLDQAARPAPLADRVQESSSSGRSTTTSGNSQMPSGKVSRFKSARS